MNGPVRSDNDPHSRFKPSGDRRQGIWGQAIGQGALTCLMAVAFSMTCDPLLALSATWSDDPVPASQEPASQEPAGGNGETPSENPPTPATEPVTEVTPEASPEPVVEPTVEPAVEPTPESASMTSPEAEPDAEVDPSAEPASSPGDDSAAADPSIADGVSAERMQQIFDGDEPETLAELSAMEVHVQEIVRKVSPTVVGVEVGPSQGSGVVVTDDGFVLTAGHVIMRAKRRATVRFRDGAPIAAETLGINRSIDSGLLKIDAEENWPYAEMGDSAKLKPGQWVVTIGHPGGFQPERGLVVRLGRVLSVGSVGIRTDCALVGGDSGGPLFDMQGRVVGINSRIGDQIVKNIHVPVNTFAETWDRLAKPETWGNMNNLLRQSWIGVSLEPNSDKVVVASVTPGGPAEVAGIQAGDQIDEFNGNEITTPASFAKAMSEVPAYELITIIVTRGERQLAVELETGERG